MYADRASRSARFNPAGLTAALALNGAILGALLLAKPEFFPKIVPETPITTIEITPIKEPVLPPETPVSDTVNPVEQISQPITLVKTPITTSETFQFTDEPTPPVAGDETGPVVAPYDPPVVKPSPPVITDPTLDRRFARDFQPDYPPGQQRLEVEGKVVVRVLIGTDGRVRQVEQVSATDEDFFTATRRRALSKWRFTPATRDGVAIEAWKTISVRFEIQS